MSTQNKKNNVKRTEVSHHKKIFSCVEVHETLLFAFAWIDSCQRVAHIGITWASFLIAFVFFGYLTSPFG